MTSPNDYGTAARAYLQRARDRLNEQRPEALFYAALELRCAVEARQDEYINAQKQYVRSIPRLWKIGDQGSALESVSDSTRIQHLSIKLANEVRLDVHHVPVTADTRKEAARLKDFLHAQEKPHGKDHPWWRESRERLVKVYQSIWACCRGRLLSPVFLLEGNVIGNFIMEINSGEEDGTSQLRKGALLKVTVDYLDRPPESWVPDVLE